MKKKQNKGGNIVYIHVESEIYELYNSFDIWIIFFYILSI